MDSNENHFRSGQKRLKHREAGISLADAGDMIWTSALIWADDRRDFGELRMAAIGYIGSRLYRVAYVERDGGYRVISLRKANPKEYIRYAQT